MPMGMADVATVLFTKFMKFDASEPHWPDRDRFILSAGHGSMLLYSLLHLTGYADMTLDELKHFRQLGSKTAGHPEYGHASGIETTTGPLGQGLGNSVGFALAERLMAERFGRDIVDHYTYVIAGDGCLMEGIGQEAITLAGHLGLGRLIVLFDDNGISIDGPTSLSTSEDHKKRFAAAGWHVQAVDGHDPDAVQRAIRKARNVTDKPSMIACKTIIGFGAPTKAGTAATHGSPLGKDEVAGAREKLGWSHGPFDVPEPIFSAWRKVGARGKSARRKWVKRHAAMAEPDRVEFDRRIKGDIPAAVGEAIDAFKAKVAAEKPVVGDAQVEPGSARSHQPGAARHGRRLGRPHRLEQHQDGLAEGQHARRRHRPLRLLRHPRARDGRGHERHGAARRHHPLRRHLPGVHRLLPALDPSRGADGPARDLRHDPRFDRSRRGRPDPSAGRASGRAARHSRPAGDAAGRHDRDGRVLAARARIEEDADRHRARRARTCRPCATPATATSARAGRTSWRATLPPRSGSSRRARKPTSHSARAIFWPRTASRRRSCPCRRGSCSPRKTKHITSRSLGADGTVRVACEAASGFGWERWLGSRGAFVGMKSFGASAKAGDLYKHFGITAEAIAEAARRLGR